MISTFPGPRGDVWTGSRTVGGAPRLQRRRWRRSMHGTPAAPAWNPGVDHADPATRNRGEFNASRTLAPRRILYIRDTPAKGANRDAGRVAGRRGTTYRGIPPH